MVFGVKVLFYLMLGKAPLPSVAHGSAPAGR